MPHSRDAVACRLAREYLLSFASAGVTEELLRLYLEPTTAQLRPTSIGGIYERLLESAQNANMRAGVVGKAIGGVSKLRTVLCDFDPNQVCERFTHGWEGVLDAVQRELAPRGKIRRTARSIWPLFCRTVLSGAEFLSEFSDGADFHAWVEVFDRDDRIRPALPMLLSYEIDGFGFPLACDFLKELGYLNFGKPDVHVKAILSGLALAPPGADDYRVFKSILRIARGQEVTPYYVDKLFWLVGSGYFYNHRGIGSQGRIGTDRERFIREARAKLDPHPGKA